MLCTIRLNPAQARSSRRPTCGSSSSATASSSSPAWAARLAVCSPMKASSPMAAPKNSKLLVRTRLLPSGRCSRASGKCGCRSEALGFAQHYQLALSKVEFKADVSSASLGKLESGSGNALPGRQTRHAVHSPEVARQERTTEDPEGRPVGLRLTTRGHAHRTAGDWAGGSTT